MFCVPHYLVRLEGHFGTVNSWYDQWSFGVRVASFQADSALAAPTWAAGDSIANVRTYLTSKVIPFAQTLLAGTRTASNVWVDQIKINRIGPNGKYESDTASNTFRAGGVDFETIQGGGTGKFQSSSTALVVSLRTNALRGKAAKGRIYLPGPAVAVDTMGLVTSADADQVTNDAFSAFQTLVLHEAAAGGSAEQFWRPAVISMAAHPPAGIDTGAWGTSAWDGYDVPAMRAAAPARPISQVSVGRRLDVQQRRSNRTPETGLSAPLTFSS